MVFKKSLQCMQEQEVIFSRNFEYLIQESLKDPEKCKATCELLAIIERKTQDAKTRLLGKGDLPNTLADKVDALEEYTKAIEARLDKIWFRLGFHK